MLTPPKKGDGVLLRRELDLELPFVNIDSLSVITATSGLITPVSSGFGFMAQLNGGRSREIVIATRGTTFSRHDRLRRLGAQSLLSVGHYCTGAFTVLDKMSEMLARYAQAVPLFGPSKIPR